MYLYIAIYVSHLFKKTFMTKKVSFADDVKKESLDDGCQPSKPDLTPKQRVFIEAKIIKIKKASLALDANIEVQKLIRIAREKADVASKLHTVFSNSSTKNKAQLQKLKAD